MSGSPAPKRGCFSPSPTPSEGDFIDYESILEVEQRAQSHPSVHPLPLCSVCSSAVCASCVSRLRNLGMREEIGPQLQLDKELLELIPKQKQRPRRKPIDSTAPPPHFRLPLLSETPKCNPETIIHGDALAYITDGDMNATRSHMSVDNILARLRESLAPPAVPSHSETELRDIALQELNKLPKFRKLSIIAQLFQQATNSLSVLIEKSQVESYSLPFSHSAEQLALCTQLNTVGSYGLMTLLNSCDNYSRFLFTPKLSRQVLSIVSTISQIIQVVPEVGELIFLEETPDSPSSPFPADDLSLLPKHSSADQTHSILDGVRCKKKAKFPMLPLDNKRNSSKDNSPLFQQCQLIGLEGYHSIAQSLINQVAIVLLHPQMNREIAIACLNLFSSLNLHNPGNGPECLKNILRDDQLNVLFELDNLDYNVLTAVVRFYSSIPLTPYFIPLFQDNKLFARCLHFLRENQRPGRVILELKLKTLSFLANRVHLHRLPLGKSYVILISELTQNILSSFSFCDKYKTRNNSEDLFLLIRLVCLFLYREYPAEFLSKVRLQRNSSFQEISGEEILQKLNATCELLQFDDVLQHQGILL